MAILIRPHEIDRLVTVATQESDDAELLRRYRDTGNSEAFESIVRRHARTVLGVCLRILLERHAAEDAFQATFLQLVRKVRTLHSPVALAGWLYRTARRTALRQRRQSSLSPIVDQGDQSQSPLDLLSARELLTAIEEEIARLPEKYQLPLIFCYLDGLRKGEAAERLGLSVGVFRGRLDRGREKLRQALIRRGFAPTAVFGLFVPITESASAELVRSTVSICTRGGPTPTAIALLAANKPSVLMNAGLVAGLLLLVGLGLIAATGRTVEPAPQPKLEQSQTPKSQPQQDLYGDPLPPDAIARIGSIRWRHLDDFGWWLYVVPSPTGNLVATGCLGGKLENGLVRVWDLSDGRQLCELPWPQTHFGRSMRFTPDGSRLMILAPRGVVKFHDPLTGKLLAESKPLVEEDVIRGIQTEHELTRDGRWIVTKDNKGTWILTEIIVDPAARPRQVKLELPAESVHYRWEGFTCDGNALVSNNCECERGLIVLRWDVRTGKVIRKTAIKDTKNLVLATAQDGKRIATGLSSGGTTDVLRVWDTETGAEIVELEDAKERRHWDTRFSPDGKRLVSSVLEGPKNETTVMVWELDRGKVIGRVKVPHWCSQFFLLPDGKTILAASGSLMFGTWDIATGRRLSPITGHESTVRHIEFTPDGKTLLTTTTKGLEERITAWDTTTGQKLHELEGMHGSKSFRSTRPACVSYLESASFVITPGGAVVTTVNGTLIWSDMKTGRELRRVTPKPIAVEATMEEYVREERVSLALDPQTGKPAVVGLLFYGPSQAFLLEPEESQQFVTLCDAESGELLAHRSYTLKYFDPSASVSPDAQVLARISYDSETDYSKRSVALDSAFTGRGSFKLTQPDHLGPVWYFNPMFTPDGQTLISLMEKSEKSASKPEERQLIQLWEVRSGKKRLEFTIPFVPSTMAISPDGRFLAGSPDNRFLPGTRTEKDSITIWDLETGAVAAKRSGSRSLIDSLVFRPDGKALASGHTDGTALVWDLSGLPGVKMASTDRDAAWKDLSSADAAKAYRAIVSLSADPECVAFLRGRLKPVAKIPTGEIQKLVKDLGNDEFTTREAATKALTILGDAADAELRTCLRGEISPEQQQRIEEVLAKCGLIEGDPDRLRLLRCVEILERVGSAHARTVLGELTKGAASARLTREAAMAMRRLRDR